MLWTVLFMALCILLCLERVGFGWMTVTNGSGQLDFGYFPANTPPKEGAVDVP